MRLAWPANGSRVDGTKVLGADQYADQNTWTASLSLHDCAAVTKMDTFTVELNVYARQGMGDQTETMVDVLVRFRQMCFQ